MKAVQYTSPGRLDLVEVPQPKSRPDQILIRVEKVTICGSDLHTLHDSLLADYPFAPGMSGHECVGVVEKSGYPEIKPGDRMLVIPPKANAMAEYLVVEPRQLIPLPDGLNPELGVLAQQLGTVIFCCRRLENVLDKVVVVVGQGPAGLLFTTLLYHMGAKQVIGLDIVDHRLAMARRMGAAHALNVQHLDPVEAIRDITAGQMADVVIEAVGKEETINLCPQLARPGGELALFGVPKRSVFPFAYEQFLRRQLRTFTSAHTQAEPGFRSFHLALDFIAQGRLNVSSLITHRLPFTAVHDAFQLAETKQDGAVKVLLDFSGTPQ